LVERMTLNH